MTSGTANRYLRASMAARMLVLCAVGFLWCTPAMPQATDSTAPGRGDALESTEAADWFPEQRRQDAERTRETLHGALRAYLIIIVVLAAALVWKFLLDSGTRSDKQHADPRAEIAADLENAKLAHTARRMEREYRTGRRRDEG